MLVADGLFVDVLIGANWLKASGSCIDVSCLESVVKSEKLKLKKLPNPSKDFVGSVFVFMLVKWLRFLLVLLLCVV